MSESPHQHLIPSDWRVTREYRAPFKTVNAAMRHTIERYTWMHNGTVARDDTPGSTRYDVFLPAAREAGAYAAILYVEYLSEDITLIRCHPFVQPVHGMNELNPEVIDKIQILMHACWEHVATAVRYTHPDFTRIAPSELAPPVPSWNHDSDACLAWKETYARDMTDRAFAEILGIDYGTLRNHRTRKRQKRTRKRQKL